MRENQHELLVVAEKDLLPCWAELQVREGKLSRQLADELRRWHETGVIPDDPEVQELIWTVTGQVAGNVATGQSVVSVGRLLRDFRGLGRYVEKSYNGMNYIIFKGYAGLRFVFTGTRYLADNPKIVSMGIGRLGVRSSVMAGAKLTVALVGAVRIAEYLLRDEATLGRLIGSLATDVVKIGAASAIGYAVGALVAGAGVVSTGFVSGPLIACLIAGGVAGLKLDDLDSEYGITEKLVAQMESAIESALNVAQDPAYFLCRARVGVVNAVDDYVEMTVAQGKQVLMTKLRRAVGPIFYPGWASMPR